MSHFIDHKMSMNDQLSLLKRVRSQMTDARTRFVRANTAMLGMYHETEDPAVQKQVEVVMARLCAIIDTIDAKVIPRLRK